MQTDMSRITARLAENVKLNGEDAKRIAAREACVNMAAISAFAKAPVGQSLWAKIVIGIIVLAIVAALVSAIIWYNSSIKPINSGNPQDIKVDIKGSAKTVAQTLEENGVIKSALAMRIYMKKNNTDKLVAGKYLFSTSDDVKTILDKICNGEIAEDEVKITFIEGKNMRYIAKKIAENTNNSENDIGF